MNQQNQPPFEGLILSNVTNQNTPTLSPHSSIKSNFQQQQNQQKQSKIDQNSSTNSNSNNLFQENQILKQQIEVLKFALMEIYKEQKHQPNQQQENQSENNKIEGQLFKLIHSLQQNQQMLIQQQQQQHITPTKSISPKKAQPKQSRENFVGFCPYIENKDSPIKNYVSSANSESSLRKKHQQASSTRRRRCDRVTTPCNQHSLISHQYQIGYQMESKFTVTPTSTNSRGIIQEIQPLMVNDSKLNLKLEEENTSRVIEYEIQDSRVLAQSSPSIQQLNDSDFNQVDNDEFAYKTENQSDQQKQQLLLNRDSSQIQLKYAKILEELENSNNLQLRNHENNYDSKMTERANGIKVLNQEESPNQCYQDEDQELEMVQTPQKLDTSSTLQQSNIEQNQYQDNQEKEQFSDSNPNKQRSLSSSCSNKHFHVKNKKSSQYEQKQFYEYELHQLKSELEQFNKEEEKLLSIIEQTSQPFSLRESAANVIMMINNLPNGQNDQEFEARGEETMNQSNTLLSEQFQTEKETAGFQQLRQNIGDISEVRTEQTQSPIKQKQNLKESLIHNQSICQEEEEGRALENQSEVIKEENEEQQQESTLLQQQVEQVKEEVQQEDIIQNEQQQEENEIHLQLNDNNKDDNSAVDSKESNTQVVSQNHSEENNLQILSHQEMLQNLLEVTEYLNAQECQIEEEMELIKPVKIQSPVAVGMPNSIKEVPQIIEEEEEQKEIIDEDQRSQEQQSQKKPKNSQITHQRIIQERVEPYPRNKTPQIQKKQSQQQITPIRQKQVSADRKDKLSPSKRQQQQSEQEVSEKKRNSTHCLITQQEQSVSKQQQCISHSKKKSNSSQSNQRSQKAFLSQQKQRGLNIQNYIPLGSSSKRKVSGTQIDKSPSIQQEQQNSSVYSIFKHTSNQTSPLKQMLKSERRYDQSFQGDEQYAEDIYSVENLTREQKLLSLEQLSKQQSLAQGLKQQELPDSEEEEQQNLNESIRDDKIIDLKQQKQEKQQDLFVSGHYYGMYSKEKSEELKNQRTESIKKAEELLSQFIIQKSCRPYFINNILTRPLQIPSASAGSNSNSAYQSSQSKRDSSIQKEKDLSKLKQEVEDQIVENLVQQQQNVQKRFISDQFEVLDEEQYKTFIVDANGKILEEEEEQLRLSSNQLFEQSLMLGKQQNLYSQVRNLNEVSFQNQEQICQVTYVQSSLKTSGGHSRESSRQQQTFLNIEIPAVLRSPAKKEDPFISCVSQNQEYSCQNSKEESLRPTQSGLRIARRSSLNQISQTQFNMEDAYPDSKKETIVQEPTPDRRQPNEFNYGNSRNHTNSFINSRRKSHEQCKARAGMFSQQKKSTQLKKKRGLEDTSPHNCYQHNTNHSTMNQTSSHTAFQKFQMGVNQQEKGGCCSKTLHCKNAETIIMVGGSGANCLNDNGSYILTQINNGISSKMFHQTFVDPEFFYEKRSKSVIKRREELIRKKEEQNRSKIEAKYQKIDQIRQTRNQKLLGLMQNHTSITQQHRSLNNNVNQNNKGQRLTHSKCKHTNGGGNLSHMSYHKNNFNHLESKSDEDEGYLEINANKTALDENYLSNLDSNQNTITVQSKKHAHNFDSDKDSINTNNNKALNTITPLSVQQQSHQTLQHPSFQTTNCKTSLLISECSSFRQAPQSNTMDQNCDQLSSQNQQQNYGKHQSKSQNKNANCNLAYKKQQTSQQNLKQNIINRTLRMEANNQGGHSKSRVIPTNNTTQNDMSNIYLKKMQSTIEVSAYNDSSNQKFCYDKNGTMSNTLHSSSSFTNNKTQQSNKGLNGTQSSCGLGSTSQKYTNNLNGNGTAIISKKYQIKQKDQKLLNSSRSNQKLISESMQFQPAASSYYNSKKTTTSASSQNPQQQVFGSEAYEQQQLSGCFNCQRLISKGLSTDFCLNHLQTPQHYD